MTGSIDDRRQVRALRDLVRSGRVADRLLANPPESGDWRGRPRDPGCVLFNKTVPGPRQDLGRTGCSGPRTCGNFGVRVERWIISDSAVRYKSSLWKKERLLERSTGKPLNLAIEVIPCDSDGNLPNFPHVVRVVGADAIEPGDGFRFRAATNVDRFLAACFGESRPSRLRTRRSIP